MIGYVWPGGGENTYNGYPTVVNPLLSPGYVAPYPGKRCEEAVGWTQNVVQLDGDEYSPSGAIVAGSTGDLIFALNYTSTGYRRYSTVLIRSLHCPRTRSMTISTSLIPPEFTGGGIGDNDHVVTTITNNYGNIYWYN